jgi:integrase
MVKILDRLDSSKRRSYPGRPRVSHDVEAYRAREFRLGIGPDRCSAGQPRRTTTASASYSPLRSVQAFGVTDSGRKDKNGKPILKTDVDFRALRRTCATLFGDRAKDPKSTQAQLRHADPTNTLKHYQKSVPASLKAAANMLENDSLAIILSAFWAGPISVKADKTFKIMVRPA